jgi:hypothetical protein
MELKEKIDIIDKKADISNKKLIAFLAIAGGSWLYGITPNKDVIVTILSSVAFLTAVMGISTNIIKLSELQTKLKGLQDE